MLSDKFISATKEYATFNVHVNAPYLRKTFVVKDKSLPSSITICGLGFYRLFINGIEITKSYLAPYISNVDHYIYYDNYELNNYLKNGINVIGIILGNGMLNCIGGFTWDCDKASFRSAPKVAFSLEHDNIIEEADETIKTFPSPITFDDLRCGERFDANLIIDNWNQIDYDDSLWNNAIKALSPNGTKRIADIEPIKIIETRKPQRIFKSGNGYIYDFNYNTAGKILLKINGKKNQKLKILHGEIVKNNKLDLTNITFKGSDENYSQCIMYTCKDGYQEYSPSFTYMGFQYVYIEGIDDNQATEDLLTMLVMCTNIEKISTFECSSEVLNNIYANAINSTQSNFYHFPTDCPQREKNGWTGDIAFSCNQIMMNFKASKNLKGWLRNVVKSQKENGQIPGIVPTVFFGYDWGNGPAWDSAIIEVLYRVYQYENDIDFIKEHSTFLLKYLKYLEGRINDDNLLDFGLGDWCQVEAKNPSIFTAPVCVSDTLISIDIYKKAAILYKIIGENDNYKYCLKIKNKLLKAFRKKCIDKNYEVLGHCQTSQAMALYYGAFKDSEKQYALKNLLKYIKKANNHFDIGVLGSRVIFRTLTDNGYGSLAYKLITNKTFPSYAWQLKFNATSLWESFYDMDENFNMKSDMTFEVLSMNHHFWSDVVSFFMEYYAGIKVNENMDSYPNVTINPTFIDKLNYVKASHTFANGKTVTINYHKKDDKIDLTITIPDNFKCKVKLLNKTYYPKKQINNYKIKIA